MQRAHERMTPLVVGLVARAVRPVSYRPARPRPETRNVRRDPRVAIGIADPAAP
ncbi:hypothetical protein [Micromonospora sp. AKA38]|uniref:hypothetical protein n=1 Tax=Micromonospora sp. AKA38 TaxID=2733861 RepID=UPI0022CA94F3|nr:hypothetical protein [Micromonospora sp. AKA38]GHJ17786.1 hypothetical protein TPA0908_57810 [Micromonospora sp. AKA38]